ncbi:GPO family capsid scaffolding protein [Pseudomonas protegens]|uniref:GPO family capsid scaffolding protein n=1 Tax=Pseudomonas protegens TaxID=380021 RepID=UPI001883AE4F|nr:GPO family capsid scaffolding protein [Pseudomonas protegens]MBF0639792.1 GPO family capsid scaffolding protein [Pseudomonas protegens]
MPRSLVSFWKRVATSGPTVDGRDILPQELRDIAETYKAATYTAVIWSEHERWYGSHGTVYAVRLVEDAEDLEPGQVALEAQLKPNDKLLWLNDQGEKLFSSIEITPNFANSGKAYLTGLAVTDSPASLGTQELYFSSKTSKTSFFGSPVELSGMRETEPEAELKKFGSMFARFFKRFAVDEQQADTSTYTTTESTTPMDEATALALKTLRDQFLVVVAGLDTLIEGVAPDTPEPEAGATDGVQSAVDDVVSTAETDRAFSKRRQGKESSSLAASMARMEKKFSELLDAPSGRTLQRTTGTRSDKRRVV